MSNIDNLKPFKKGDDPRRNTEGRPKGAKGAITLLRERGEELIPVEVVTVDKETGEKKKKIKWETRIQAMHRAIFGKAAKGNTRAWEMVMNYLEGKPTENSNVNVEQTVRYKVDTKEKEDQEAIEDFINGTNE